MPWHCLQNHLSPEPFFWNNSYDLLEQNFFKTFFTTAYAQFLSRCSHSFPPGAEQALSSIFVCSWCLIVIFLALITVSNSSCLIHYCLYLSINSELHEYRSCVCRVHDCIPRNPQESFHPGQCTLDKHLFDRSRYSVIIGHDALDLKLQFRRR